jgi:hypothetical protein
MGQQQLLLIVLGVIVVGVAVAASIYLFGSSHNEAVKDELVSQCQTIGISAQQFFVKPIGMGGGDNAFNRGGIADAGYVIPSTMRGTTNGTYDCTGGITATTVTITATPRPITGKVYGFTNVICIVTPSSITTTVN